MTRFLPIAALLLVAGCGQQESPPETANEVNSAASAPAEAEAAPAIEGEWSVTAVDGKPVGADSAMTASFNGSKVIISSGCFRRSWTYTQKRNVVSFTTDPGGSANCGGQSPGSIQESAYAALNEANIAVFGKEGKEASLSGTGGTLTLQRR